MHKYLKRTPESFIFMTTLMFFFSLFQVNSQNTYRDLEGRFSFEQPADWKLNVEQMNMVYTFGDPNASARIVLTYMEDVESLDDLITMYLESVLEIEGGILPPPGSIVDMTLNGASARWIEYPFDMNTGNGTVKLYVYLGASIDPQKRGMAFFSMLNDNTLGKYGDAIKHSFETLQLHDLPLSGITNVQEVNIDYSALTEKTITIASTFEHELFTIDVPAGWVSLIGSGETIVKLDKEGDQTCSVSIMGKKKNQFGSSIEQIHSSMVDGLIAGVPSMKKVKGPYDLTTSAGEVLRVEEFEGSIEVSGQSIALGALIAAAKNKERGLGFMGMFSGSIKKEAVEELTTILKTLR